MSVIVVATEELKTRYLSGDFSPLEKYYSFELMIKNVEGSEIESELELHSAHVYTDVPEDDVLVIDKITFMAQEFRIALHQLIADYLESLRFCQILKIVSNGILVFADNQQQNHAMVDLFESITEEEQDTAIALDAQEITNDKGASTGPVFTFHENCGYSMMDWAKEWSNLLNVNNQNLITKFY